MKARFILLPLILFFAAGSLSAELVFGGTGEIYSQLLVEPGHVGRSRIGWDTRFSPILAIDSPSYDLFFRSSFSYEDNAEQISTQIDELYLVLDPLPFLQLRLGRFSYLAGTALFLSNTRYFVRRDLEELLTGRIEKVELAGDMAQLSFFLADHYLRLTAAPFTGRALIPDPGSPWFPDKDLPGSITVYFPTTKVLVLDNLSLEEAELPPFNLQNLSASLELGGTIYPVDYALLYYHGSDNSPLVKAAFEFPQGLYESYDIILTPVSRSIDALGLNLALQLGPFTFWTDDSFTSAKTFLTNRLSSAAMETALAQQPYLELCLGMSYRPPFVDGLLAVEYRDGFVFGQDDPVIEPLLSSVLVVLLQLDLWDGKLSPSVTWIESLHDPSRAVSLRVSFRPAMELEARLSAPLFFGPADSELGQFRENYLLSAGVIWRF